jgi:polygalacturonase
MNFSFSGLKLGIVAMLVSFVSMIGFRAPAQNIPLPAIPKAVFNITNYGAIGDDKTLNTAAIQKTIDTYLTADGGTALVPAGKFLFSPITLTSSINSKIVAGSGKNLMTYNAQVTRLE